MSIVKCIFVFPEQMCRSIVSVGVEGRARELHFAGSPELLRASDASVRRLLRDSIGAYQSASRRADGCLELRLSPSVDFPRGFEACGQIEAQNSGNFDHFAGCQDWGRPMGVSELGVRPQEVKFLFITFAVTIVDD